MTAIQPGTIVDDRYKVVQRIGSGGMADVYLSEDRHLNRRVALKVMHARFARDRQFVERFEREAQAAAGLQHQNIVSVYDRGQVDDTYYIAMEYVAGRTLKDVINAMGALEPRLAVHLALQILAAAGFAHGRGLVHRDIKPQNVMIDDEWKVKVADFGIAHDPVSGDITQAGQMIGTAQYISPEQAQGKPVSAASDLYSVGVVLFEMLAGRVPYDGESSVPIALKHINDPVPRPGAFNPAVPPPLDAVVMRAMAKSPVERYGSAAEFTTALENARTATADDRGGTEVRTAPTVVAGVSTPPPTAQPAGADAVPPPTADELARKRRRRNWLIAAAVALLIVAGAVAWYLLAGSKATVPNVIGRSAGDARARVAAAGFNSRVFSQQTTRAPEGEVYMQSPEGGTKAKKDSTVILTVSAGPPEIVMPDVAGMKRDEAIEDLEAAGLKVEVKREFDSKVPAGRAIRTTPLGGEMAERGSVVDLYVSRGAKQVEVPTVEGMDVDEATDTLEKEGFDVKTISKDSPEVKGQVLAQKPAAGGKADDGSTVTLTVATGSNTVPNVKGMNEADAAQQLEDAGFRVSVSQVEVTDADDDGNVVGQDPPAGLRRVGTTVTIEVGVYSDF